MSFLNSAELAALAGGSLPAAGHSLEQLLAATLNGMAAVNGNAENIIAALAATTSGRLILREDFMAGGTTGGTIGEAGWAGYNFTVSYRGYEAQHPGILRMSAAAGQTGALYGTYMAGTGISGHYGTALEFVLRLDSITGVQVSAGISYVNSYLTNGGRVLHFDPALSPNWRLLHHTQAGATTYQDTGLAAVANEWVKAKLYIYSGSTVLNLCTTSNPTEVAVTNSGADTHSTLAHCPQVICKATGATKNLDLDLILITAENLTRL